MKRWLFAILLFGVGCAHQVALQATASTTTTTSAPTSPTFAPSTTTGLRPTQVVDGTFGIEGGPAPGPLRPLSGLIVATDTAGRQFGAVATDGHFTLTLDPGEYRFVGRSSTAECSSFRSVFVGGNVQAYGDGPTRVGVICEIP